MAMQLDLPAPLDAQLERMARSRNTSKEELVIEAIWSFLDDDAKTELVLSVADGITAQYAEVMRRLADA